VAWETSDWKINIETVPSPVVLDRGRVLFTGGYNAGCLVLEFTRDAAGLSAREIFRLKASQFGATQHSPIWHAGHLFGIRADGQFVCLKADGEVAWTSGPQATFGLGPLLLGGGMIFALKDTGRLSLIEPNPAGYRELAAAQIMEGHECWAPLALADGRLLVRDLTRLVCLSVGQEE
jgi:outer membrane protein assembly factor BamB